jgi:hypothetical protein
VDILLQLLVCVNNANFFWRIEPDQDIGAFILLVNNTEWFELLIIRDTFPIKRPATDLTDILTYKEQGRNYLDKDFVIVSDLLNPGNLRLLV